MWIKKHGGKSDDLAVYTRDIDKILRAETETEFDSLVGELSQKWSLAFIGYFDGNLKSELKTKACKFVLEEFEVFDPYSGITNNIYEGFYTVYKQLLEWKHVPLDSIALAFYFLQQFYRRVILQNVQQQQNSVDCGIFAIAFLVELCANGFNNLINSTFDVSEMRNHLSVCIENKHFQPFPKTQDNVKPKR